MKKLIDLERNDCRWPLDDRLFCADPKERGSYCETHAKRAYKAQTDPSTTDRSAPKLVAQRGQYKPNEEW